MHLAVSVIIWVLHMLRYPKHMQSTVSGGGHYRRLQRRSKGRQVKAMQKLHWCPLLHSLKLSAVLCVRAAVGPAIEAVGAHPGRAIPGAGSRVWGGGRPGLHWGH